MDQIWKRESLTMQARTSDSVPRHEWRSVNFVLFGLPSGYWRPWSTVGRRNLRVDQVRYSFPLHNDTWICFDTFRRRLREKWCFRTRWSKGKVRPVQLKGWPVTLTACLHGVGGPQVGEVTCGGSPHLSGKRDQIKMRDYMVRRVTPRKHVNRP